MKDNMQTEIESETALFTASSAMTLQDFRQMNRDVNGAAALRAAGSLAAAFLLLGSSVLLSGAKEVGIVLAAAAVAVPFVMAVLRRVNIRRAYTSGRVYARETSEFSFYKTFFTVKSSHMSATIRYEDLYRVVEGQGAFYLLPGKNQAMRVPTEGAPEEFKTFLRTLGPVPEKKTAENAAVILGLAGAGLLALVAAFIAFKPQTDILRAWVGIPAATAQALWMVIVLLDGYLVNRRGVAAVKRKAVRWLLRVLTVLTVVFLFLIIGLAGLGYFLRGDLGGSEITRNANGTYLVRSDYPASWNSYTLYAEDGALYLRRLRPSSGPGDDDPQVTAEEWWQMQAQPETESAGGGTGVTEPAESTAPQTEATTAPDEGGHTARRETSEYPGYQAILYAAFPEAGTAQISYGAKGESWCVVSESGTDIEYLMYDRDSRNGSCGLYVLYRAGKDAGGSWGLSNAVMEDVYAYEYGTGRVVSSGQTSWANAGNDEYREMTGE